MYWARASPMVMVQCTDEDGAKEGVGAGSSTTTFSIGTSSSFGCLPASQSAAMAAISFWSVVRPSRRALEREEAMVGVVWTGERERRWMTAAMAGAAVYIAMMGAEGRTGGA